MKSASRVLFAAFVLIGCKSTPEHSAAAESATAKVVAPPAASLPSEAPPPSAAAASAAPSSSAPPPAASAAKEASPCPEGARKNDAARYCITLPPNPLAVSYEGDSPAQGIREELEIDGDRVVITIDPAKSGKSAAALKKEAVAELGASLVESGDLPNGYWTDAKNESGDGHIIQGVVVSKYEITCTYWVNKDEKIKDARAVCGSLRTF